MLKRMIAFSHISTDTSSAYNNFGFKFSTHIKSSTDNNPLSECRKLIVESNCLSCHKEQEKVVGPEYAL